MNPTRHATDSAPPFSEHTYMDSPSTPMAPELDAYPSIEAGGNGAFSGHSPRVPRGQLSLLDVLQLLWQHRRFIARVTAASLVGFTVLAFLLPKHYIATTRLMPPDYGSNMQMALALPALSQNSGGAGGGGGSSIMGLASQLLGLNSSGDLFIGVVQSETIEDHIIRQFNLMELYSASNMHDAREALENRTEVKTDKRSGIIFISVEDKSPQRAADIAQEYVKELDRVLASVNTSAAHRERVFIESRLREVKEALDASSQEFATFSSQNAAIDVPEQAKAMVGAAADLQAQLIVAESELSGLQQIYTDNNIHLKTLKAHVAELQRQVDKFGGMNVDPAKDASLAKGVLYPSIRQLPLVGVKYLDLYRRTKVDEAVFEFLTKEFEIAKVQEAREVPSVQVLDPAMAPDKKSSPHRLIIMLAGLCLGFAASSCWIVARLKWDETNDRDPRKLFAQEIFRTTRTTIERSPFARRIGGRLRTVVHRFQNSSEEDSTEQPSRRTSDL